MQHKRPLLIAVTGGIASGKSLVCKYIEKKGYEIIYADKIGHECLNSFTLINKIKKCFGENLLDNEKIDRKKLGEIVFSSVENLEKLNRLIHPEIYKKINEIIKKSREKVLFFEIPLLFENNLEECFDYNILVFCDKKVQTFRLIDRNKYSKNEAIKRIDSQLKTKEKLKKSDFILENNSTKDELYKKIDKLICEITKLSHKEIKSLLTDKC